MAKIYFEMLWITKFKSQIIKIKARFEILLIKLARIELLGQNLLYNWQVAD